jgi:hypothetical protein
MSATIQDGLLVMLKTITYGFIALTLLLLSGCFFTSFPSGQPEEFTMRTKETDFLLGSTSKEVLDLFGPPHSIAHKDNATYFIYQWRSTALTMVWFLYIPIAIGPDEDKELHCILMEFGEDDVLRNYKIDTEGTKFLEDSFYSSCTEVFGMRGYTSMVPTPAISKEQYLEALQERAMQGEADAQMDLFWKMRLVDPPVAHRWLCRAADQGNSDASYHLGGSFRYGTNGLPIDPARAYVWYSLAAQSGYRRAKIQRQELLEEISANQLKEGQALLDIWQPGQCEQELVGLEPVKMP